MRVENYYNQGDSIYQMLFMLFVHMVDNIKRFTLFYVTVMLFVKQTNKQANKQKQFLILLRYFCNYLAKIIQY